MAGYTSQPSQLLNKQNSAWYHSKYAHRGHFVSTQHSFFVILPFSDLQRPFSLYLTIFSIFFFSSSSNLSLFLGLRFLYLRHFRPPLRCQWDLRPSGMFRSVDRYLPTFRDNLSVPLEDATERSVIDSQCTLRNVPEERRSHFLHLLFVNPPPFFVLIIPSVRKYLFCLLVIKANNMHYFSNLFL
jgi:hypothetical protein